MMIKTCITWKGIRDQVPVETAVLDKDVMLIDSIALVKVVALMAESTGTKSQEKLPLYQA